MDRDLIIQLHLIPGVGPATIQKLLQLPNTAPLIGMDIQDIVRQAQIPPTIAEKIFKGLADTTSLEKELALLQKARAKIVTVLDADYPEQLKNIHVPPPVLYYQGAGFDTDGIPCAIVGSRAANAYGRSVLQRLIRPLVEHGCTIVSGGARGIDAFAHYETIQAGGKTVVVLGSGLLNPYPPEHVKLFASIIAAGGTIVSPFPLRTDPVQGNFPARNRIIAGLSRCCIVIQAAAKSGALITAQYALEQGREVFAVPGPIDDPLSAGCHALLQQGAGLIQSAEDLLKELNIGERRSPVPATQGNIIQTQTCENDVPTQQETIVGRLLISCSKQAQSLDELAEALGLDSSHLHEPLFQLQIQGKLVQNLAGLYETAKPF